MESYTESYMEHKNILKNWIIVLKNSIALGWQWGKVN